MTPIGSRGYRSAQETSAPSSRTAAAESEPFLRDVELGEFGGGGDGVGQLDPCDDPLMGTDGDAQARAQVDGSAGLVEEVDSRGSWRLFRLWGLVFGRRRPRAVRVGFLEPRVTSFRGVSTRKITLLARTLRFFAVSLMILGVVQILGLVFGLVAAFFPDEVEAVFSRWRGHGDKYGLDLSSTADIVPVKCHSHNDYWRTVPLRSAITAGCTSVEADVWLYGDDLFVGHGESSLEPNQTLNTSYVQPLLEILAKQNPITNFHTSLDTPRNGIFDTDPRQSLVLLIDFKTNGDSLWPVVSSHLEPLRSRQYLTHFDGVSLIQGAITVVVTGNAPFDRVVTNTTYRDMFFDAPLNKMATFASRPPAISPAIYDSTEELAYLALVAASSGSGNRTDSDQGQGHSGVVPSSPRIYSPFNSYYASTSITDSIGIRLPYLTTKQRSLIEDQIAGAHHLGLQVRYWEIPAWPISWRNYLWRELVSMGIDYLNVDDLKAATRGSWRSQGGFGRLIWGRSEW